MGAPSAPGVRTLCTRQAGNATVDPVSSCGLFWGITLFLVLTLQVWKQGQGTANPTSRALKMEEPSTVSEPALSARLYHERERAGHKANSQTPVTSCPKTSALSLKEHPCTAQRRDKVPSPCDLECTNSQSPRGLMIVHRTQNHR